MAESILKDHNLKSTSSRRKVLSILEESDRPLAAEEIYSLFPANEVHLSTVYRCLRSFERGGIVKEETNAQKENVYSLNKGDDTHVLVCVKCHKRVPLKGCPYHEVNERIEKETGFELEDQNIEIYGICGDCKKSKV